jgi:hypothetical protein
VSNEVQVIQHQSAAVVPFQQLEKMATVVAKSGLFGVKTYEAAIAVMLLAQSEGVHPMEAVKDWHIMEIKGRTIVSMKSEAMLSRFLEAGGKVKWHKLADDGASATFAHRDGGEATIDWDLPRAQRAGLADKDVWKQYRRAMLRSRVVSEGVRTVLPQVLRGRRTPEENMHMEDPEIPTTKEEAINGFGKPIMPQEIVDMSLRAMAEAESVGELTERYKMAYASAKAVNDEQRMNTFKLAYDARKGELQAPPERESPQAEGEAVI